MNVPLVTSVCSECGAPLAFELGVLQVQCSHCDAGMVVSQGSRLIKLLCPCCGGNFYYLDGSMSGQCPYCATPLLALTHDRLLRFVILPTSMSPPAGTTGATLIFLPFWHLWGMLLGFDIGSKIEMIQQSGAQVSDPAAGGEPMPSVSRRDSGPQKVFRGRVIDLSLPDTAALAYGVTSLRLRGSLCTLEPLLPEHEAVGTFVPAAMDLESVREQLRGRAMNTNRAGDGLTRLDCQRQDIVAEELAVLYYPFWLEDQAQDAALPLLWDAVSGDLEPLAPQMSPPAYGAATAFDELQVIELTCQSCKSHLPPGNHSMVLPCPSCHQFWLVTRQGLVPFAAHYAKARQPAQQLLWLPFWHLPVQVRYGGKEACRVAHLRDVLGILPPPSTLPTAPGEAPLSYFAPAYGARTAPKLDHAARDMTRLQPLLEECSPGAGERFNCFYGPTDAAQLAYVVWIHILPGVVIPRLRSLRIQVHEPTLWYIPFEDRGREIVNLLTGFRYDRAVFRGVSH